MAIQVTSEERLQFKKRARQRLLGAIVLLVAAAIILPLLLDKTPRPLNSDIVINMVQPASVGARPDGLPALSVPAPKTVLPVPAMSLNPTQTVSQNAKTDNDRVSKPVQPVAANKMNLGKNAVDKTAPHKISSVADTKKTLHGTVLPVSSETIGKSQPAAVQGNPQANDSHARYVVQLGAFSSVENVRQLRERLTAVGVNTYTENLSSGATRVRAGPFTSLAQADKTLARISMAGIQAQVVSLSH